MQKALTGVSLSAAQQIGRLIREQRSRSRLTGVQLAQKAGISQSRVAKIENGYSASIDATQIGEILDILNATKIIRQQVAILLFQTSDKSSTQIIYPFLEFPSVLDELHKSLTTLRCYTASGISALLQTPAYRMSLLKRLGLSEGEAQLELGKTIVRQDTLWDTSKTFYIVMPETALYTLPVDPKTQIAQLDRLERMIGIKNIHIGVIPTQAGLSVFATGTFTFYDEILYIFSGDRVSKMEDTEASAKYLNVFTELGERASFNAEAVEFIRRASDYFVGVL